VPMISSHDPSMPAPVNGGGSRKVAASLPSRNVKRATAKTWSPPTMFLKLGSNCSGMRPFYHADKAGIHFLFVPVSFHLIPPATARLALLTAVQRASLWNTGSCEPLGSRPPEQPPGHHKFFLRVIVAGQELAIVDLACKQPFSSSISSSWPLCASNYFGSLLLMPTVCLGQTPTTSWSASVPTLTDRPRYNICNRISAADTGQQLCVS
jgi:hypothetical protein